MEFSYQALLYVVCAVCFGMGALWQVSRRRRKPKVVRRVERMTARATPANAKSSQPEASSTTATTTPHGVLRPSMYAITPVPGDVTASEIFIQRAHLTDVDFYKPIEVDANDMKAVEGLFTHCAKLNWQPNGDLAKDIYEISLSPIVSRAFEAGFMPRINATSNDLQIISLDDHGQEMGEAMNVADYNWGSPSQVQMLWALINPAEHKHALEGEMHDELATIKRLLAKVKLLVPAVRGLEWQQQIDKLIDLSLDVSRLRYETGRAQKRFERADELATQMHAHCDRIDAAIQAFVTQIDTLEQAEDALKTVMHFMPERELAILVLRVVAVMRVISSNDYIHGIRCSNRIEVNVKEFPSVKALVAKARQVAIEAGQAKTESGLRGQEVARLDAIKRDADLLEKAHDETFTRLSTDVKRLQEVIDAFLIIQCRPRRHAVRMNEHNRIDAILELAH